MIQIDGSQGEGGGQIIRTALALSCLTGKSFSIENIRANRSNPGLQPQHLTCVNAAQKLCGAKVEGAELGSKNISFYPEKLEAKNIEIDVGTAGSCTLLLQSILLPALFVEKNIRISIVGGTDTKWSMPSDYFTNVFLPQVQKCCETIECKTVRRGFYPKGNGMFEIKIKPKYSVASFPSFEEFRELIKTTKNEFILKEQQNLLSIKGVSFASKTLQQATVAERMAKSAEQNLKILNVPINVRTEYCETLSDGAGITLWANFGGDEINFRNPVRIGADCLGERGKSSEEVGKEAAINLFEEINSKAPVDSHLADNLIPFMAIFGGEIKVAKITEHAKTNIFVVEQFLGKTFEVDEKNNIIRTKP